MTYEMLMARARAAEACVPLMRDLVGMYEAAARAVQLANYPGQMVGAATAPDELVRQAFDAEVKARTTCGICGSNAPRCGWLCLLLGVGTLVGTAAVGGYGYYRHRKQLRE